MLDLSYEHEQWIQSFVHLSLDLENGVCAKVETPSKRMEERVLKVTNLYKLSWMFIYSSLMNKILCMYSEIEMWFL